MKENIIRFLSPALLLLPSGCIHVEAVSYSDGNSSITGYDDGHTEIRGGHGGSNELEADKRMREFENAFGW